MQIKARPLLDVTKIILMQHTEDVQCSLVMDCLYLNTEGFFFLSGFCGTPVFEPMELAATTLKL